MADSFTISGDLMNRLYNTLMAYANETTYDAPRIGGVVAGCPRGPKPTKAQLTMGARWALREIDRDVLKRPESGWHTTSDERNELDSALLKLGAALEQRDNAMNELFALKLRLADIQAAWTTMTKNSVRVEVSKP